ncbi:MAG: DUF4159 domain-containing protein [Myxococcota bacterium]
MPATVVDGARSHKAPWLLAILAAVANIVSTAAWSPAARAVGEASAVDLRGVEHEGGETEPRPNARQRLAWEVRKRTSVDTRLEPTRARLDDPSLFTSPFLYWSGAEAFPPLSDAEVTGLRRFVELGGFVLIDDASPDHDGFDASIRRTLERAFPTTPLTKLPATHTIFRAFYLLERPVGRVRGPDHLWAIERADRVAVAYSRHDLGGALARDNLGTWLHTVTPGGDTQREQAARLAVNMVMYALCLDYKDDQVHAPFIMRRRGGAP